MGKTRYQKCVNLLKELKSEFGETITLNQLEHAVRSKIGDDLYRTVRPSIKLMIDLGLILPTTNGIKIK